MPYCGWHFLCPSVSLSHTCFLTGKVLQSPKLKDLVHTIQYRQTSDEAMVMCAVVIGDRHYSIPLLPFLFSSRHSSWQNQPSHSDSWVVGIPELQFYMVLPIKIEPKLDLVS